MSESKLVYHGTNNEFDEFSFEFVGTANGINAGFGIYFTESEAEAFTYGNIVLKCLLILKNNLSNNELTIENYILREIITNCYDIDNFNYFNKYGKSFIYLDDEIIPILEKLKKKYDTDTKLISYLIESGCNIKTVFSTLIDNGFTHTIDNDESFLSNEGIKHYVVYDLNSIEILHTKYI